MIGIEPTTSAWKAEVLPLNYTRIWWVWTESNRRHLELQSNALPTELQTLIYFMYLKKMAVPTGIEPAISCVTGRHVNRYTTGLCTLFAEEKMEEVEGFEPPRGVTRLSVFKTDPFSQTWVYLQYNNQ